jgi:hypothetical protein
MCVAERINTVSKGKYLNINFQLLFKAGVQALPALQAELALQNTEKL